MQVFSVQESLSSSPSVAGLPDGSWLLVWSSSDGAGNGVWGQRYAADGSTLGPIYQINPDANGSQDGAHVIALSNDTLLVTWNEGNALYGQRLDSTGQPLEDEFLIGTGEGLEVSALAGGGFAATYRANPGQTSDWVALRQYDSDGVALTDGPVNVTTYDNSRQGHMQVTGLEGGGFVVVWSASVGGLSGADPYGVFAQQFAADGTPINAEFHVNTTTHTTTLPRASQTLALEDGGYLILWRDTDENASVRMQRFGADGRTIGDETVVEGNFDTLNTGRTDIGHGDFQLESLGDGSFALVWEGANSSGLYVQSFDINGNALTGVSQIDTTTGGSDVTRYELDLRADGQLQITWVGADNNIYHEIVTETPLPPPAGEEGTEELVPTMITASSPSVAGLPDGSWLLVWSSSDGAGNGVWGQRYAADGSTLGPIYQINPDANGSQDGAHVIALSNDTLLVTWNEGNALYGQRLDSTGQPLEDEFLIGTGEGLEVSALAGGGFAATYRANPGQTSDWVALRQYDSDGVALTDGPVNVTTYDNSRQGHMQVTGLEGGGFVVVWSASVGGLSGADPYGVFAQQFAADGTPINAEFHVNTTTHTTTLPRASQTLALEDGGYLILWRDTDENASVRMQRFGADGRTIGDETVVEGNFDTLNTGRTDIGHGDFQLESLGDGSFALVWEGANSSGLYVQSFDINGNALTGVSQIDTTTGGSDVTRYELDLRADGQLQITWVGADNNIYHEIVTETPLPPPAGEEGTEELVPTMIEDNGVEALYLDTDSNHYVFRNAEGTEITVNHPTFGAVGPDTYAGWTALQVASNGAGGYSLIWQHSNGEYSVWQMNANGTYQSNVIVSNVSHLEGQFQTDLDGDDRVLSLIEDNGDEALYLDTGSNHYVFRNAEGAEITVNHPTLGAVGPDTYAEDGSNTLHVASNDAGGYSLIWQNSNGEYSVWQMDADGTYQSNVIVSDVSHLEGQFQTDLDGDGRVLSQIENNGAEVLYLETGSNHYVLRNAEGAEITVNHPTRGAVGPDTYAGWTALQVASNDAAGYSLIWQHSNGEYSVWQMNANGTYQSNVIVSDVSHLEGQFQTDLDGDGRVLSQIEDNGDEALYLDVEADRFVFTIHEPTQMSVSRNGFGEVGPHSFDADNEGWTATQLAENDQGGFNLLWASGDGVWSYWDVDANGSYRSNVLIHDADDLITFENQFQAGLDGDGFL
ncbi:hypothetical protein KUV57_24745 [Epibacterium sp. DP7N7-1]|nr:hypothetical protein [Epibacterium sp. DP7N7-1]